jgi:hypothetical protein
MPPIFKALASITAWVLFIFGMIRLIIALIYAFTSGPIHPDATTYFDFALGVGSLVLSVVVMKLRRTLE